MEYAGLDITITLLVGLFTVQLAWFSVMLLRRGGDPAIIARSIRPLLSIWVLLWPVYEQPEYILLGTIIIVLPTLLAQLIRTPFWRNLKSAWSSAGLGLFPMAMFMLALTMAANLFIHWPELGFGIALVLCIGLPAAAILDGYKRLRLGFPRNPGQTLIGHLGLILITAGICSWSLHIYHGTLWHQGLIATAAAGLAASITHASIPESWNQPLVALAIGGVLWFF